MSRQDHNPTTTLLTAVGTVIFSFILFNLLLKMAERYTTNQAIDNLAFTPTDNQMGYSIPNFTDVERQFFRDTADGERHVLEIAAGLGIMSLKAMQANPNLVVHVNDLSESHLDKINRFVKKHGLRSHELKFLPGDIFVQKIPANFYDAIIIKHVLHYLTGDQVDALLTKVKAAARPGAKVYIVTISPYTNVADKTGTLATFNERSKQNERYPGFITNFRDRVSKLNAEIAKKTPEHLHIMDADTLRNALTRAGFQVEVAAQYPAPNAQHPEYVAAKKMIVFDGREYTGAIGCVPK